MSTDFSRRLREHRNGKSASTNKGCLDWQAYFTWECPSYLYMSKLERFLQRKKSDDQVIEATKMYPFFGEALKLELDKIPTTDQESEPDWSKRRLKKTLPRKHLGPKKGQTVAERKAKKSYHVGVKKQRADRMIKMKDVFASYQLSEETIQKMEQVKNKNSPKYDFL